MKIFDQVEKYVRAGNYALLIESDGTHTRIVQRNLDSLKDKINDPDNAVKKDTRFQLIDRSVALKLIHENRTDEIMLPTSNISTNGWNKLNHANISVLTDPNMKFYRAIKEHNEDVFKDNAGKEAYIGRIIDKAVEECNELALALAKMKQFGPHSCDPFDEKKITNLQKVQIEYNDVLASFEMLFAEGYKIEYNVDLVEDKIKKIKTFFAIADDMGSNRSLIMDETENEQNA